MLSVLGVLDSSFDSWLVVASVDEGVVLLSSFEVVWSVDGLVVVSLEPVVVWSVDASVVVDVLLRCAGLSGDFLPPINKKDIFQ